MLLCGVAFTLLILRGVDSALRAHGMRTLHRHNGKKLYRNSGLGHTNRRHQAGQSSTDYDDFRMSHLCVNYEAKGCQSNRKLKTINTPKKLNTTPTATPNCPAARCARTVAASTHLQRKFQMTTPK